MCVFNPHARARPLECSGSASVFVVVCASYERYATKNHKQTYEATAVYINIMIKWMCTLRTASNNNQKALHISAMGWLEREKSEKGSYRTTCRIEWEREREQANWENIIVSFQFDQIPNGILRLLYDAVSFIVGWLVCCFVTFIRCFFISSCCFPVCAYAHILALICNIHSLWWC